MISLEGLGGTEDRTPTEEIGVRGNSIQGSEKKFVGMLRAESGKEVSRRREARGNRSAKEQVRESKNADADADETLVGGTPSEDLRRTWDASHPLVSALLISDAKGAEAGEVRPAFGGTLERLERLKVSGMAKGDRLVSRKGSGRGKLGKKGSQGGLAGRLTHEGAAIRANDSREQGSGPMGSTHSADSREGGDTGGAIQSPALSVAIEAAATIPAGPGGVSQSPGAGPEVISGKGAAGASGIQEARGARLAGRLERLVLKGDTRAHLRLDPPLLGSIEVEIEVHKGEVSLLVQVESQTAAGDLLLAMEQLRESLEEKGLSLKEFELTHDGEAKEERGGDPGAKEASEKGSSVEVTAEVELEINGISADGRLSLVV